MNSVYTEFVILYIGAALSVLLSAAAVVLLLFVLRRLNGGTAARRAASPAFRQAETGGVAFCASCGTRFDANLRVCPRCGKLR